ncbi:MAG: hypothetical protein WBW37_04730 [Methyloceanibacter sp.]
MENIGCASPGYLQPTEIRLKMAVQAVISELVSAVFSPFLRENAGKFAEFSPKTTIDGGLRDFPENATRDRSQSSYRMRCLGPLEFFQLIAAPAARSADYLTM